jgi:pyrimidine deaminase RibD-like protein
MATEPTKWKDITPAALLDAVGHIRKRFDAIASRFRHLTQQVCYNGLHSPTPPNTTPKIFKDFLDVYLRGIQDATQQQFGELLEIGLANSEILLMHPVEWAKLHLEVLILVEERRVKDWIKHVCDEQDFANLSTSADFEELILWTSWRAPRLIHMQPSGNTPYDFATTWLREDQERTEKLLDALADRFVLSASIKLDDLAGDAHIKLAKTASRAGNVTSDSAVATELGTLEYRGSAGFSADDRKFAQMALDEARKSVAEADGRVHPLVGAVVIKEGKVLSSAHRGEIPQCHAEFIALEKKLADAHIAGATVYTTLEPCTTRNHPKIPCATRLVERRVGRVVIGMLDPDPRIRGRGQMALRKARMLPTSFPQT